MQRNKHNFVNQKNCEYFPCHRQQWEQTGHSYDEYNCKFCYCPMYSFQECLGHPTIYYDTWGKARRDCSSCIYVHEPEHYEDIIHFLSQEVLEIPVKKLYDNALESVLLMSGWNQVDLESQSRDEIAEVYDVKTRLLQNRNEQEPDKKEQEKEKIRQIFDRYFYSKIMEVLVKRNLQEQQFGLTDIEWNHLLEQFSIQKQQIEDGIAICMHAPLVAEYEYQSMSLLEQYYVDLWQTALLEQARLQVGHMLLEKRTEDHRNMCITPSFGPGFYDLPLHMSNQVFADQSTKRVGVTITEQGTLIPAKSLTCYYFIVTSDRPIFVEQKKDCEHCIGNQNFCSWCGRS